MKLVIKDEVILSVLCGLILQSDFGDYSGNRFAPHYIRQTISPHLLSPFMEDKIKNEHIKLRGVEPIEAEYRFLEKIRWLENYGTIIFPVKDINNRYCYFGLNPQGFSLRFQKEPNLNYEIFWPRISSIRRKGRQIIIIEKTDRTKKHYFETGEKALCVVLYKLSLDHFAFFKSKKDEKPKVNEPPKRSFGRSSSKEFGYASDTSDNNQYSDDTFSSYPDSINTTQSTKPTKAVNKAQVPPRNCMSDVEESALSKKNRRVIVTKSQTETEDEDLRFFDHSPKKTNTLEIGVGQTSNKPSISQSKSFDRIPPDYIYENKLSNPGVSVNIHYKPKRMRKKIINQKEPERDNEIEGTMEKKYRPQPIGIGSNQGEPKQIRTGDMFDDDARTYSQFPLKISKPLQPAKTVDKNSRDNQMNQSASVDSISTLKKIENRVSPTKRMLPDLSVVASVNSTKSPPVPRHRIQPRIPVNQCSSNNHPPIYTDIWNKPPIANNRPRSSQHPSSTERKPNSNNINSQKNKPIRIYPRPPTKYTSRFRPESGI